MFVTVAISEADEKFKSLLNVFCKRLSFSSKDRSCFGYSSLDNGHNLLPLPPAKIIDFINYSPLSNNLLHHLVYQLE